MTAGNTVREIDPQDLGPRQAYRIGFPPVTAIRAPET